MKWTPNHFACSWGLFNVHITVDNCIFVGCFDRVTLHCIYTSICTHIDHIRFEHRSFIVISSNQRILLTLVAAVVIRWQIHFSSFIIPILTTSCFKRWYQYLHSCVPEHFLCAAVNGVSIDVCKFLIAVNFYLVCLYSFLSRACRLTRSFSWVSSDFTAKRKLSIQNNWHLSLLNYEIIHQWVLRQNSSLVGRNLPSELEAEKEKRLRGKESISEYCFLYFLLYYLICIEKSLMWEIITTTLLISYI